MSFQNVLIIQTKMTLRTAKLAYITVYSADSPQKTMDRISLPISKLLVFKDR